MNYSWPSAKVIADTVSQRGHRITTMEVKMHRFILPEFNTHRHFCLDGESQIYFFRPSKYQNGEMDLQKYKIKDLHDKWYKGSKYRKNHPRKPIGVSSVDDDVLYTLSELMILCPGLNRSNINLAIRNGELPAQKRFTNPSHKNGETIIRGKDLKQYLMEERTNRQPIRERIQGMLLQQLNETTLKYQDTRIVDICYSGTKPCFRLTCMSGNTVTASKDHMILTENGWKSLGDINIGVDKIAGRNYDSCDYDSKRTKIHKKIDGQYTGKWNKQILPSLLELQGGVCYFCRKKTKLEVHHIIPVHQDHLKAFDIDNVKAVCKTCHKEQHKVQGWQTGTPLAHRWETVSSIEYVGERETYDIEVAGEFANFVSGGLVVHNSRNSASSRAIPFNKRLKEVLEDPAMPVFWGENQSGMSARVELSPEQKDRAIKSWLAARDNAVEDARRLNDLGVHKQLVNRIIEPYMWHTVVVTATEWDNFYSQRYHPKANQEEMAQAAAEWAAQPEMMACAYAMKEAQDASISKHSVYHLPYINDDDYRELNSENNMFKVSTARCGRVSYLNHDGTRDLMKDITLFDKLNTSTPIHFSPMEHCAFDSFNDKMYFNIKGWKSMRYMREAEKISF